MRKSGRSRFGYRAGFVHFLPNFHPSPWPAEPSPEEGEKAGGFLTIGSNFLVLLHRHTHKYLSPFFHKDKHSDRIRESGPRPQPPQILLDFHFSLETTVQLFFHSCYPFSHRETCKLHWLLAQNQWLKCTPADRLNVKMTTIFIKIKIWLLNAHIDSAARIKLKLGYCMEGIEDMSLFISRCMVFFFLWEVTNKTGL